MADMWYIREKKRTEGPLSHSELREAALAGRITPQTLVSQSPTSGWVEAKRIANLEFGKSAGVSPQPSRVPAAKKTARAYSGRKARFALGAAPRP